MKRLIRVIPTILTLCFGVPYLAAANVYTSASGDGYAGRSWYGWFGSWADTSGTAVSAWHNSENRESGRGVVIFDINGLLGSSIPQTTFHFYSFGFSGTSLQYTNVGGPDVVAGYSQLSGQPISTLNTGEGWMSFDVTSHVQSSIDGGNRYVALVFNASNFAGGSLAAYEDPAGRMSYLQVGQDVATPEPASMGLIGAGIAGVMVLRLRRRNRAA